MPHSSLFSSPFSCVITCITVDPQADWADHHGAVGSSDSNWLFDFYGLQNQVMSLSPDPTT